MYGGDLLRRRLRTRLEDYLWYCNLICLRVGIDNQRVDRQWGPITDLLHDQISEVAMDGPRAYALLLGESGR